MNDWAEFRHFKYLLAILDHQGFRAAAEYLHTAQPNLSLQARQFQEHFGLELYRKSRDGRISLTETGIAFRPIAQNLLEARDDAIAALIAIQRGEIRSLKFGCSSGVDLAVFHAACEIHREMLPACPIRPTHGETIQLTQDVLTQELDVALVTDPVKDSRLRIEIVLRNRLVVCLPRSHPCATKAALQPIDLQENLAIFYDPRLHPPAHDKLLERLTQIGVQVENYSRGSHPSEMCELVKQGYGFALIREGSVLEPELTTRPIAGVEWTVDTAIIYNKQLHPKTVPVLVRHLRRRLSVSANKNVVNIPNGAPKYPLQNPDKGSRQMSLLD